MPKAKKPRCKNKVYCLDRKSGGKFKWPKYDYYDSFVVVAPDAKTARLLAAQETETAEGFLWLDPKETSCQKVRISKAMVICTSFNAG